MEKLCVPSGARELLLASLAEEGHVNVRARLRASPPLLVDLRRGLGREGIRSVLCTVVRRRAGVAARIAGTIR